MRRELSCGVLLFQSRPRRSFLVLLRGTRIDLPKGHLKRGETEVQCALRELTEETGIVHTRVRLNDAFRFETTYPSRDKNTGEKLKRTVVLFQGEVEGPCAVQALEHDNYAWMPWPSTSTFADAPTLALALQAWRAYEERPAQAQPRTA
jgi:bis(5'-nucleosidyl)-tetraphosphatase